MGTVISTQYSSNWNFFNGETYDFGSSASSLLTDKWSIANYSFRTLINFQQLHQYVPSYATVLSADITMTFVGPGNVQVCFMTKPWEDVLNNRPVPR